MTTPPPHQSGPYGSPPPQRGPQPYVPGPSVPHKPPYTAPHQPSYTRPQGHPVAPGQARPSPHAGFAHSARGRSRLAILGPWLLLRETSLTWSLVLGVLLTGTFVALVWWQEGTQAGIVTALAFGIPQVAFFPLAREAFHLLTAGVLGGDPETSILSPSNLWEVPVLGPILGFVWFLLTLIMWVLAIPVGLIMWIVLAVRLAKP